jgi:CheY-like chemotaxis protein
LRVVLPPAADEVVLSVLPPPSAAMTLQPTPSAATGPSLPVPVTAGQILVVEDESLVRKTIMRTLGTEFHLTVVEGAAEALALIDSGKRFDVIVCDLMMPRVTGIELHEVLHARHRDQARRMLFVSGGAFVPEALAFLRAMEDRQLSKPFSPSALREKVRGVLKSYGPAAPPNR